MEAGKPKKPIEEKKYLQVINILKESVWTTTITKCILNFEVNLTIGKLPTSALAIKKRLTKAITKDKAIQFWVNTLESSSVDTQNSHL